MIGKLQRIPLREVWKDEARDFTPWLEHNIDVLNEIADFSLSSVERERKTGSFSIDVVAEDNDGNTIIIENQLGKSDHDHLGKLVTYLVAIGAKAGIWIVSDPRPEHINAITWLNESSTTDFYLVKVEAVKIGESDPAPLFTLIVGPSEEGREVGKYKEEQSERYHIRHRFWTQLLERAKEKTQLHSNISPGSRNWLGTSAGKRGLNFNYVVREHNTQVELYIDRGKDSVEENKSIFDTLDRDKDAIESKFGEPLQWQRLNNRKASRIQKQIELGGWKDEKKWQIIHHELIETMIRFEKAMKPSIRKLNL